MRRTTRSTASLQVGIGIIQNPHAVFILRHHAFCLGVGEPAISLMLVGNSYPRLVRLREKKNNDFKDFLCAPFVAELLARLKIPHHAELGGLEPCLLAHLAKGRLPALL